MFSSKHKNVFMKHHKSVSGVNLVKDCRNMCSKECQEALIHCIIQDLILKVLLWLDYSMVR